AGASVDGLSELELSSPPHAAMISEALANAAHAKRVLDFMHSPSECVRRPGRATGPVAERYHDF
ncbi:MAG: hypothetical protein RLZZ39_400, partial [Actinomycetota bacterium]